MGAPSLSIAPATLADPRVLALVRLHLEGMRGSSPPEAVYALDAAGLADPRVELFAAWDGPAVAAIGALKRIDAARAELKSMRTAPTHLRRGVAAALLDHLVEVARARGYRHLSLETGVGAAFEPALALYRRRGFVDGEAFGDYAASAHNQFLHLAL